MSYFVTFKLLVLCSKDLPFRLHYIFNFLNVGLCYPCVGKSRACMQQHSAQNLTRNQGGMKGHVHALPAHNKLVITRLHYKIEK